MDNKPLLTTEEAAAYLNIGRNTMLEIDVKPVNFPGKRIRRYRRSDLDEYVERLCTSTAKDAKESAKQKTDLKSTKKKPTQPSSDLAKITNFHEILEKLPAEKQSNGPKLKPSELN